MVVVDVHVPAFFHRALNCVLYRCAAVVSAFARCGRGHARTPILATGSSLAKSGASSEDENKPDKVDMGEQFMRWMGCPPSPWLPIHPRNGSEQVKQDSVGPVPGVQQDVSRRWSGVFGM